MTTLHMALRNWAADEIELFKMPIVKYRLEDLESCVRLLRFNSDELCANYRSEYAKKQRAIRLAEVKILFDKIYYNYMHDLEGFRWVWSLYPSNRKRLNNFVSSVSLFLNAAILVADDVNKAVIVFN